MVYDNFIAVQKPLLTSVLCVSEIFEENLYSFFYIVAYEDRWEIRQSEFCANATKKPGNGLDKANKFSKTMSVKDTV